jgi:Asp-tRNA(Asn)/Glu-tRNA(Gln) amidotransferase A subunit family amidase
MTGLADLSATDLLVQYRRRALSPVEVTQAVLDRIGAWDATLGAMYAVDAAAALAAARDSEMRWAHGDAVRALEGVPITIKDLIATKGTPIPLGTAATTLVPAAEDAPPAARAREAGAVLLGKTTMPDYGMLSSGLSSFHPLTRNPWDVTKNPGGSSSGAAAAAAAGYGPLHIGTDIGGSVRLPAGWCGICALKPSLGRIPIDPPYIGRVAGPMTRTVADSALLMQVLSAPDWRDYMSLPPQNLPWTDLGCELKGLRIALMMQAGAGLPVAPETEAAVRAAARLFEAQGCLVEEVPPYLTLEMLNGLDLFWRTRLWSDIGKLPRARQDVVLPFIHAWAQGAVGADGAAVYAGFSRIMEIRAAGNKAMHGFDFLLSPTAPIAAFPAELPCPTNDPARPFDHIAFTVPFNMTEQPAASVNCGYTAAGLPIGLQIVGRRFDDVGVLRMARAFEELRGAQLAWPRVIKTVVF